MGGREGGREGGRGDERRRGPATVSRSDCATRIARGPRGKLLAAGSQRDKARHRSHHGSVRFRRNGRWAKRTPQLAGPRKPAKGDLGKKRSVRGPPKRTMRMHVSAPIHSATRGGLETLQRGSPCAPPPASRRDRARSDSDRAEHRHCRRPSESPSHMLVRVAQAGHCDWHCPSPAPGCGSRRPGRWAEPLTRRRDIRVMVAARSVWAATGSPAGSGLDRDPGLAPTS